MYDTTIRTMTSTRRIDTQHTEYIDWTYNFDDPKHMGTRAGWPEEQKSEYLERQVARLHAIEDALSEGKEVFASDYGGSPRIWQRVVSIGMASAWPYWEPRPTVMMQGTLGCEFHDWNSLTGVRVGDVTL